ncbi:hypothetical protein HKX48_008317 [Thoreauomyces humboldtii]|nr:hypothetical protein HKX48_008317 [Thoreauomyces humboldtii]
MKVIYGEIMSFVMNHIRTTGLYGKFIQAKAFLKEHLESVDMSESKDDALLAGDSPLTDLEDFEEELEKEGVWASEPDAEADEEEDEEEDSDSKEEGLDSAAAHKKFKDLLEAAGDGPNAMEFQRLWGNYWHEAAEVDLRIRTHDATAGQWW